MSEYRAQRRWHIEKSPSQFGDYLAVNQFGGFEGRHQTRELAVAQVEWCISEHGDVWGE